MPGQIITFYSYKGGTGRTMALANAAVLLARRAEGDVLVVDWDLEAPGLHRFFERFLTEALRSHKSDIDAPEGLIEMFIAARGQLDPEASAADEAQAQEVWRAVAPERYILKSDIPSLYMLKAGHFDDEYPTRVNTFNWEALYGAAPSIFRALGGMLAEQFRYVLIDSRTGITDSSGICTMLLPERLVVVFTPNRQSLTGLVDIVERATAYRNRSEDVRPLVVVPLASRVELSEDELKRRWRDGDEQAGIKGYEQTFEALFKKIYDLEDCTLKPYFDEVQIQQATRFAYGEDIAVQEESESDRLSLAHSYVKFTRALLDPLGPWGFKPEASPINDEDRRANVVLQRLEDQRGWHQSMTELLRRRERLVRTVQMSAIVYGVGAAVALYFLGISLKFWVIPLAAAAVLPGALEVVRLRDAWDARRIAHQKAAKSLEREQFLFSTRAGPYLNEAASSRRLAERVEEILASADDRLADLGATPSLSEMDDSGELDLTRERSRPPAP